MTVKDLFDGKSVWNTTFPFQWAGKKVFITGICGTVGSAVATHFSSLGSEVFGIDCDENAVSQSTFDVDLAPYQAYRNWKKRKADIVIHCAAYKHVVLGENPKHQEAFWDNNFNDVDRLIQNVRRYWKDPVFLFISTDKAAGLSRMGRTKKAAEEMVIRRGGLALRLVNIFGSRGSVVDRWRANEGIPYYVAHATRYWMQPEDAAKAVNEVLTYRNGLYSVHNVPNFSIKELWEHFGPCFAHPHLPVKELALRAGEVEEERLIGFAEKLIPKSERIAEIDGRNL